VSSLSPAPHIVVPSFLPWKVIDGEKAYPWKVNPDPAFW
jgi:hypothetical protein